MKKLLVFLTLTLLSACASRGSLAPNVAHRPSVCRIAILPFESQNPYVPGSLLSDYFTVEMFKSVPQIEIIERKDLIKILQEQKLVVSGAVQPGKLSRLGEVAGVDAVLVGSLQTLQTLQGDGGVIVVTLKLVQVSNGKILWAHRRNVSEWSWSSKELPQTAHRLIEKAARIMIAEMRKSEVVERFSRG